MSIYVLAFLIGVVAGLRALTPLRIRGRRFSDWFS
jgi:uncharacterized membrane protein